MRSSIFAACVLTSLLAAPAALAEPSAAEKETARQALTEGKRLLAEGDKKGALARLEAAYALVRVPTTGLALARAQEANGQLVEARDTALAAAAAATDDNEAFENAAKEARALAESLLPRIPSLKLTVTPPNATPTVTVDGKPVPAAALALPLRANPGAHRLVVTAPGFKQAETSFSLAEGTTAKLEMPLVALTPEETAAAVQVAKGTTRVPLWAWISGAAGVALAGAAVGFKIDEANVESASREKCNGDVEHSCPAVSVYDPTSDNARKNRDFAVFLGTAIGSGVALGAAAIGILTAPRVEAPPAVGNVRARPWVSPTSAGGSLEVTF